jgi:hypothetical protein
MSRYSDCFCERRLSGWITTDVQFSNFSDLRMTTEDWKDRLSAIDFPQPPDAINPVFLSQHPFCHPISKTNLIKY